jgi:hypothetical protein
LLDVVKNMGDKIASYEENSKNLGECFIQVKPSVGLTSSMTLFGKNTPQSIPKVTKKPPQSSPKR